MSMFMVTVKPGTITAVAPYAGLQPVGSISAGGPISRLFNERSLGAGAVIGDPAGYGSLAAAIAGVRPLTVGTQPAAMLLQRDDRVFARPVYTYSAIDQSPDSVVGLELATWAAGRTPHLHDTPGDGVALLDDAATIMLRKSH